MSKGQRELAKMKVLGLEVEECRVLRVTVNTGWGFVLEFVATEAGSEAFIAAVRGVGLEPSLQRRALHDHREPAEYIHELSVEVPADWQNV